MRFLMKLAAALRQVAVARWNGGSIPGEHSRLVVVLVLLSWGCRDGDIGARGADRRGLGGADTFRYPKRRSVGGFRRLVFSSPQFLFLFLPLCLAAYALAPRPARNLVLLLASLLFYAWGEAGHLWLLLGLIAMNWTAGLVIARDARERHRMAAVSVAIVTDLAALVWFKYAIFLGHNLSRSGFDSTALAGIVLPIGISFFMFHNISYVVDVYRRSPRRGATPSTSRFTSRSSRN